MGNNILNPDFEFIYQKFLLSPFILTIGILTLTLFGFIPNTWANNLSISNFSVSTINSTAKTITFILNVSQESSWRNATNYDAVWMFLKYSTDGGSSWSHATLNGSGTNPSGFSAPTGFEIIVPGDETGFFLQRATIGSGTIAANGVKVVWNYGQDGLSDNVAQSPMTINKIFGIEMVYIPDGAFFAGDGNSNSAYRFKQGSADNDPWYLQNENAITTTNTSADGYYYSSTGASGENSSGDVFFISLSFPKGYKAFYLMKYELTEGQWVSFFNTLSNAAKVTRDVTGNNLGAKNSDSSVDRNTIVWDANNPSTDATSSRPSRAAAYISWPDLLAYADWAGLRPITELEFEKASRGKDISPVVNEFSWGSTSYNSAASDEIYPNGDEAGTETISDSAANINRNNLAWSSGDGRNGGAAQGQKGPLRAGIFAQSSSSRITSGAGYYGNMELSGNVSEQVVTFGRAEGRLFLGTHGDGKLSTLSGYEGNATNSDWPGLDNINPSRGITGTIGSGYKGGDFNSGSTNIFQISDRTYAVKDPDSEGYFQRYDSNQGIFHGGRLARSVP